MKQLLQHDILKVFLDKNHVQNVNIFEYIDLQTAHLSLFPENAFFLKNQCSRELFNATAGCDGCDRYRFCDWIYVKYIIILIMNIGWKQTNDKSVNRESTQGVDASQPLKWKSSNISCDGKLCKHSHDESCANNFHNKKVVQKFPWLRSRQTI